MAKYTILTTLYQQAIAELTASSQRKYPSFRAEQLNDHAHELFDPTWWAAVRAHESHLIAASAQAPAPEPKRHLSPELQAELDQMMAKYKPQFAERDAMFEANYRSSLISFFTGEDGISQALAEQIVDQCILGKVEA